MRDVVRAKEPLHADLKLDSASDDALLDAMAAHPILLNPADCGDGEGGEAVQARRSRHSVSIN